MLPVAVNVPADCALVTTVEPKDAATKTSSTRAASPTVPVIELLTRRDLPRDVNDDGVSFPALHQLLLAQISVQELFDEFDAAILHELRVRLQAAIQRHGDSPRAGKGLRILDRHLIVDGVWADRREALDQVQRVAMEIPGPVEPVLAVEVRHIDDQRVPFPVAHGMPHI